MKRIAVVLAVALLAAGCVGAAAAPATSTAAPATSTAAPATSPAAAASGGSASLVDIGAGLKGPPGLTATVYATGLKSVAAFAFDSSGRLWVATADYTDSGKDAIYLVAKAGATPVEVIEGTHTPLGLLWLDGELYVAAKGGVTAYAGFDGTRFATHRSIVALASNSGEVNGLALAPDGRIWLGVSAPCDHCSTYPNDSAAVLSFEPDGTDLVVEARGIRAAVGLAIDASTGHLLVTMDQRDDLGDQTPGDWLAVVESGQDWRFPDCYGQGGSVCAGVPSPIAVLDPHAAVASVAVVNGQLGAPIGHAAIVAEWAFGKLELIPLDPAGTTTAAEAFVTGITSPVGVALGLDRALYAGDWATGTVYRVAVAAS
jgi:glucose/arabinose dehydrogenase